MTRYESSIKKINAGRKPVFDFLSDMNNFDSLVPEGKVNDFEVEGNTCSFSVNGMGRVEVRLVQMDPGKLIRFESENGFPFRVCLSVELEESADRLTEMKLVLEADISIMIRMMAQKPIEEGLEMAASKLAGHFNKNSRA